MARARAEEDSVAKSVRFHEGDATALPFPDAQFDAVAVLQVLEYVEDVDGVLAELHRTLKPGGRFVIIDADWRSMIDHSLNPALTTRILDVFDGHLADPNLPRTLGPRLRATPLSVTSVEPFVQLSVGKADAYTRAFACTATRQAARVVRGVVRCTGRPRMFRGNHILMRVRLGREAS